MVGPVGRDRNNGRQEDMRGEPPVVTRASARVLQLFVYVVVCLVATVDVRAGPEAGPDVARPRRAGLTGQSACNLVPLIAPGSHPLRKHPALKRAVDGLSQAGDDPKKNSEALARFERALSPLWKEAARAFARPGVDPKTGEPRAFAPASAKAFLTKWVFSPTPVLRVGEERFEPVLEVSAWMAQAACRAGETERAVAIARAVSGGEGAPLRAFAALLLIEGGALGEADVLEVRELALSDSDFLGLWVRAELAKEPAEKGRWNELAGRLVSNPDQEVAWKSQKSRL